MGTVKDQMQATPQQPIPPSHEKGWVDKVFGLFKKSAPPPAQPPAQPAVTPAAEDTVTTFATHVEQAHSLLASMIAVKQADVSKETGQERANTLKVARLEAMNFHLEAIIELGARYTKDT